MLQIGVMQASVHDEVLSGVIGEHNEHSSKICFDVIELEKAEQVITDGKEQTSCQYEAKGVGGGELVSFECGGEHECECDSIEREEEFVGHFIEQCIGVGEEQQPDDDIGDSSYPDVFGGNVPDQLF